MEPARALKSQDRKAFEAHVGGTCMPGLTPETSTCFTLSPLLSLPHSPPLSEFPGPCVYSQKHFLPTKHNFVSFFIEEIHNT